MSYLNIQEPLSTNHEHYGVVSWQSPSNIALIKYWGKRPIQLPENASISFTLSEAITKTKVKYRNRSSLSDWVQFSFEGKKEEAFAARIIKYLDSIKSYLPWIEQMAFEIESENSFPHSSGIASSASSMSALALCLCDIEQTIYPTQIDADIIRKKASYLSRLGSGSAARSVYPGLVAWGTSKHIKGSSDEYAIPVSSHHVLFKDFHDDVLIVSAAQKSVSSSAGHALMDTNIFANTRYTQADRHMELLLQSMQTGDLETFGKIVEDEAMTLHALMMCSNPSYILMEPNTIAVIKLIRNYRKETNLPIFFTLDAGPNVHILYPDSIAQEAASFIEEQLLPLAHNGQIIKDRVGPGPIKIS